MAEARQDAAVGRAAASRVEFDVYSTTRVGLRATGRDKL
jgi:hypothetical protein